MDRSQRKLWERACRDLRSHCPTRKPVVVYIARLPVGEWGEWSERKATHAITINSRLFEMDEECSMARETLVHEWAHVIVSEGAHLRESNDHSEWWGVAYSHAYRAVFDRWERG